MELYLNEVYIINQGIFKVPNNENLKENVYVSSENNQRVVSIIK